MLSDGPSAIQRRITAAQSRLSQIEACVNTQRQESASHSVKHLTRPRDIFRRVSRRTDGQLVHYRPPHSDVEMCSSASLKTSLQSREQAGRQAGQTLIEMCSLRLPTWFIITHNFPLKGSGRAAETGQDVCIGG